MDELRVGDAIEAVIELFRRCNKYIDETMPWSLAKDEEKKARLNTVLYNLLEGIRFGAVLLEPFMPETSQNVYAQINTKVTDYDSLQSFGNYEINNKVTKKPVALFARIDSEKMMAQIHEDLDVKVKPLEHKEEISIDDFAKTELRVGTVISCEKHPKADKLLVFKIKCGPEERQIVSGIAQWYKPEELVGKKVIFVANLKPATLRGVQSQGMILSAEDENGNVEVISVDKSADGSEVR